MLQPCVSLFARQANKRWTFSFVADGIELLDEESYEEFYQPEQFFSVHLSNGAVKELIANGSEKTVEPKDRSRYATLVRKARVLESVKQVGDLLIQ